MADYTSDNLTVLQGLEAVRKRPGMYIGSTSESGLHHLVYEVVDNSIDEAMAGHCKVVKVVIHKDGSVSVEDDGRGIPTEVHPKYNMSGVEVALTKLHAGGKFNNDTYKVSGGLHGVGVSVVNALSTKLIVEVIRGGKQHVAEFKLGKTTKPLTITGDATGHGTKVIFYPDPDIFKDTITFDFSTLSNRLRELAFLNSGVKIVITDERSDKEKEFYYEGGIGEYVKYLNQGKQTLHEPIFLKNNKDHVDLEVSIQYTTTFNEMVHSFVNNINTREGGTHLSGFKTALTRTLNNYGEKNNLLKGDKLGSDDSREGLTAIISIKIPEPQFEGQTKAKLGNSEVKGLVDSLVTTGLSTFLEENPGVGRLVIEKALSAKKARDAARKARELIRRKSILESTSLPGKLADCQEKSPEKSEIFIVEGDSAGGCFSGDAKVALADGRDLSFKELVKEHGEGKKNYCYTLDKNNGVKIALIEHPRITKKGTEVLKVILDNGKEIICTPDHKFRTAIGNYIEAKNLDKNISLAPLYRKKSEKGGRITIEGYEMVFDSFRNNWVFTHVLADKFNTKNNVYSVSDGSHKHHMDFNKLNNNPGNIVRMRKEALSKTYFHKSMSLMKLLLEEDRLKDYDKVRVESKDKSLLKSETIAKNYFDDCIEAMNLAVSCYNHKIKEIIPMTERMDVYDLEVKETHNFALAAGVFVHNSAKQGRSREFQAILPLRGKILNVERSRLGKVIANNEISNIITALGTSIADEFDIDKIRYHKIVIMCDADSDGNHIATLLLTFFYRYMRDIIEKGYLYKAQPPLYLIKKGNTSRYAYTENQKLEIVKEMGDKLSIQRYKGLGEMNPEQLWDTTMAPDRRVLRQITIEDAALADQMFSVLMGDEVEPRRNFIQDNAKEVINLDV